MIRRVKVTREYFDDLCRSGTNFTNNFSNTIQISWTYSFCSNPNEILVHRCISMSTLSYEGLSMQAECCIISNKEIISYSYTYTLCSKNLDVRRCIIMVNVIVPLKFQEMIEPSAPISAHQLVTCFWLPAWWAIWLHWLPPAECSNTSIYLLISPSVFVSISLLYSVENKTYYYYKF